MNGDFDRFDDSSDDTFEDFSNLVDVLPEGDVSEIPDEVPPEDIPPDVNFDQPDLGYGDLPPGDVGEIPTEPPPLPQEDFPEVNEVLLPPGEVARLPALLPPMEDIPPDVSFPPEPRQPPSQGPRRAPPSVGAATGGFSFGGGAAPSPRRMTPAARRTPMDVRDAIAATHFRPLRQLLGSWLPAVPESGGGIGPPPLPGRRDYTLPSSRRRRRRRCKTAKTRRRCSSRKRCHFCRRVRCVCRRRRSSRRATSRRAGARRRSR